jgi:hypothetical protein
MAQLATEVETRIDELRAEAARHAS